MKKETAISVRVPKDLKEAVERAASADERSLASYVQKVLADHLRSNGYLQK